MIRINHKGRWLGSYRNRWDAVNWLDKYLNVKGVDPRDIRIVG